MQGQNVDSRAIEELGSLTKIIRKLQAKVALHLIKKPRLNGARAIQKQTLLPDHCQRGHQHPPSRLEICPRAKKAQIAPILVVKDLGPCAHVCPHQFIGGLIIVALIQQNLPQAQM